MDNEIRIPFVILILVASLAGCRYSSPAPQSAPASAAAPFPRDAEITSSIEHRLSGNEQTSRSDIRVQTEQGVVTLTGIADTEDTKQRAEAFANDTYGVKKVLNAINIGPINTKKPGGPRRRSR